MSYSDFAYSTRGYAGDPAGAPPPVAATTYTISLAGTISSSGALTKTVLHLYTIALAGTIASSGTLHISSVHVKTFTGTIASQGALQVGIPLPVPGFMWETSPSSVL